MKDSNPTVRTPEETAIHQANLRLAWTLYLVEQWGEVNREKLFAAAFEEWGPEWVARIQED